jgi:hypothetical protein
VGLHGGHGEGLVVWEPDGEGVGVGDEDWIRGAFETGPDVCSEVLGQVNFRCWKGG